MVREEAVDVIGEPGRLLLDGYSDRAQVTEVKALGKIALDDRVNTFGLTTPYSTHRPTWKSSQHVRQPRQLLPANHASNLDARQLKKMTIFKLRRFSNGGTRAKQVMSREP
jgi:hypothetical protein